MTALSGRFRSDGLLLAVGGEDPVIKVFDASSSSLLRVLKGHLTTVRTVSFMPDKSKLLSGSDDGVVMTWDISTKTNISSFVAHTDHVRAAVCSAGSPVWATGSYDHTIKLWDMRHNEAVMTMDHGAPVEALLYFPNGSILVSAGGTSVKLWDVLSGGTLLHELPNHQKTVTCLAMDSSASRLLSGGVDHFVKVVNAQTFNVMHTFSYDASVLSLALSGDDTHLAVGMSDGIVSVKRRAVTIAVAAEERETVKRARSLRYFMKSASKADVVVRAPTRRFLENFDAMLRNFRHKEALDAALVTEKPVIVVSVLQELLHRGALKMAVSLRHGHSLEPLLSFLVHNVTDPRFAPTLLVVAEAVLDTYGSELPSSVDTDKLFLELRQTLAAEVDVQEHVLRLLGALDLIIAAGDAAGPEAAEHEQQEHEQQEHEQHRRLQKERERVAELTRKDETENKGAETAEAALDVDASV
eukprot:TRINITY_DN324_c0_g1_i1.p1 TRINITY_DN324_c0_g1~~TRINITY_DN324_c0_g1_i1.p1  ORF type:complete len:469 (+),score=137.23 TRINITY_DN324_c0_g1_i1:280-1686(+)